MGYHHAVRAKIHLAVFSFLLPLLLGSGAWAQEGGYRIERLEPPHWWLGFKDPRLELLVHGPGVADLTPKIAYPGVAIEKVTPAPNRNYLFIALRLGGKARPGQFEIAFMHNGRRVASRDFALHEKNPSPNHARGFSGADAIYLITPDRFANGDPGNDDLPDGQDRTDRSELFGRHGGDLQGIEKHLDYIGDMGFTAIWLNPVLENLMPESSYHGYATTDFYRVDPRFGSNAQYQELVQAAKERGIGVIMDMIVNHTGLSHWWILDPPAPDWFNLWPDARTQTSHVHTANIDIHASEHDRRAFADGWFVPTMPDLNQRNPFLARYLIQNTLWWIETLGLSGIRMDTYPYPDKHFMSAWTRRVMEEYPDFNIVGEEWQLDPEFVAYWQAGKQNTDGYVSHLPSLMDFPLQDALVEALNAPGGDGWLPLYRALAKDVAYAHPERLVVFPDNHDMSRIYTQLNENFDLFRMALAYILTVRGTPQIYYGTEILMHNRGSDSHGLIRSDFPGGWEADKVNGFTGEGLQSKQRKAQAWLRKLLRWRRGSEVIHRGALTHFVPEQGAYVYFRHLGERRVMVAFNKNRWAVRLDAARFAELLRGNRSGREVLSGKRWNLAGEIKVPGRGVIVVEIGN